MSKKPKKLVVVARAMCFVMIIMMAGLVLYMYSVERIKNSEEQSVLDYRNIMFDRIYSELDLLQHQAKESVINLASDIEEDLRELDLDKVHTDLDNGVMNTDMYKVIRDGINGKSLNGINNYKNSVIVMSQDGIFEDFNYERASVQFRSWDDEINHAWNKYLEEEAINKLLIHSRGLIATEKINHLGKAHIKITELTEDNLREVYLKEGIAGLQNYQFKVAAYITESGDIFGNEDIVSGVKQKTHKLIIIQEFNLYDQLQLLSPDIFEVDEHSLYIQKEYSITISIVYITGLFYLASTVLLLFYFSHLYNYYIGIHSNAEEKEDDG